MLKFSTKYKFSRKIEISPQKEIFFGGKESK